MSLERFQLPYLDSSTRLSIVPINRDILFDTDLNGIYIGDGSTYGGVALTGPAGPAGPTGAYNTPRVQSVTNAATITPDVSTYDNVDITAIAQAFTIANPTGTPVNFQKLMIRIIDDGSARAITYGNAYTAGGMSLPSTTVASKTMTLGFIYNAANSLNKWQLIGSAQEA